jgi:hypothetical protein
MTEPPLQGFTRFIAIDIHKHYLMIGGIDAQQRIVLQPRKVELHRWLHWAEANLHPSDAVVLEATTNAWTIYDQLASLVGRVVVVHPAKVKLIAEARVKTDRVDVLTLAKLLRADMLPEVTQRVPGTADPRARPACPGFAPPPAGRAPDHRQEPPTECVASAEPQTTQGR